MTKAQERAIETLKSTFLEFYGHPEMKEFKDVTIKELATGSVHVTLEVGYIGDEGTMREVMCRDNLSVCIGKRGGYYNYRGKSYYRRMYKSATLVCCHCQW